MVFSDEFLIFDNNALVDLDKLKVLVSFLNNLLFAVDFFDLLWFKVDFLLEFGYISEFFVGVPHFLLKGTKARLLLLIYNFDFNNVGLIFLGFLRHKIIQKLINTLQPSEYYLIFYIHFFIYYLTTMNK